MNKKMKCVMRYLLTSVVVLALCGCATTTRDWEEANRQGTIEAYEQFLKVHPDADQTNQAKRRLEELRIAEDWDIAKSTNTIDAYRVFLSQQPVSKYAKMARAKLDQLVSENDWKHAKSMGTIASYEEFLQKHPKSGQAPNAEQSIQQLKEEREWKRVEEINTRSAFAEFVKNYPSSSHRSVAKRRLIEMAFQEAVEMGTFDSLDGFIKEFFGTELANEAFIKLKEGCKPVPSNEVIPWSKLPNIYAGTAKTEEGGEVWYGIDLNSFIYPPLCIADESLMVGPKRFYRPSNAAALFFRDWSAFDGYLAKGLASVTEKGLVFRAEFTPPSTWQFRTKPEVLKWEGN